MQCIEDFSPPVISKTPAEIIQEYERYQQLSELSHAEKAMFGMDKQLLDMFGGDFAKGLMGFFHYDANASEPLFRRFYKSPFQTRPLRLKDERIIKDLTNHLDMCRKVELLLGRKLKNEDSMISKCMNKVHKSLCSKFRDYTKKQSDKKK